MSKKPDIHRLIELQQLLLAFGSIERAMYLPNQGDRHESDVDHSYSLAMTAWFLTSHFSHLDISRVFKLALAHDLIEVHSGDTFVYGPKEHLATKADRERAALEQLQKDWSDFPEMTEAIQDYAQKRSEEAKFVYALDKLLPPMLHILNGGKVWKEHKVTLERFTTLNDDRITKDSLVYPYYQEIIAVLQTKPNLFGQP